MAVALLESDGVATAGVLCPVRRDGADLLVVWDLARQVRQGRAIAFPAGGDLNRPDVGCGRVLGQMDRAPLEPPRRPMFTRVPFPIAEEFDPGAVHHQVEGASARR